MTLLHSLFILIFSGSNLDKVRSIFIIHDLKESESIKISDFYLYINHMFYFLLKEMNKFFVFLNDLIQPDHFIIF